MGKHSPETHTHIHTGHTTHTYTHTRARTRTHTSHTSLTHVLQSTSISELTNPMQSTCLGKVGTNPLEPVSLARNVDLGEEWMDVRCTRYRISLSVDGWTYVWVKPARPAFSSALPLFPLLSSD